MKRLLFIILMFSTAAQAQSLIPLGPDNITNPTAKKGDINYTDALLDEQGADPVNGIMTPVPNTPFLSGYSTRSGYPAVAVIDLKADYILNEIALYSKYGVDSINFEFSDDGKTYRDKITYHPSGIGFFYINLIQPARYVKVYNSNKGYQKVMELYFYGTQVLYRPPESPDTEPKVLKTYTIELMSDSTFRVKNQ